MLYWAIPGKSSRACHTYHMVFLEIFTVGKYHRDMAILKILASNSPSGSEFMAFLTNDK